MNQITQSTFMPALATAEWWASHVFGGTVADNGGDGIAVALSVVAGAQGRPAPSDKRGQFTERLTQYVERFVQQDLERDRSFGLCLSTDYGPEGILADLADALHLGGSFPWKTMTWTYPTHVTASLGYGASSTLIWQADEWSRPLCGAGKWNNDGPEPWKCSDLRFHDGDHTFDTPDPLCQATITGWAAGPCQRPASHSWHRDTDDGPRRHEFVS